MPRCLLRGFLRADMKDRPEQPPLSVPKVAPARSRDWVGFISASLVTALAVANLGWWWGIATKRLAVEAQVPSAPSTAACFLLLGIGLGIRARWPGATSM